MGKKQFTDQASKGPTFDNDLLVQMTPIGTWWWCHSPSTHTHTLNTHSCKITKKHFNTYFHIHTRVSPHTSWPYRFSYPDHHVHGSQHGDQHLDGCVSRRVRTLQPCLSSSGAEADSAFSCPAFCSATRQRQRESGRERDRDIKSVTRTGDKNDQAIQQELKTTGGGFGKRHTNTNKYPNTSVNHSLTRKNKII